MGAPRLQFSEDQLADIRERYESGTDIRALVRQYGCSWNAMRRQLELMGVYRPSEHRSLTDAEKAEIALRYKAGESMLQLAKAYGYASGTIQKVLVRGGTDRSPRPPDRFLTSLPLPSAVWPGAFSCPREAMVAGTEWQLYPSLTAPAAGDTLLALDKSDTSADAAGTVKQAAVGALYGQVVWPSGDTSGAGDAAAVNLAIAALPAGDGGVVTLVPSADWNIECGQVAAATGVYINAAGCWINARGSGDVFRFVDTSAYSSRDLRGGGILGHPVIDGTHTTGNSAAVHAGDILGLRLDVQAQNFTAGTTSKGVWLDNQNYWTEQLSGRIFAQNCTSHVVFDVSGTPAATATGSFDRSHPEIVIAQGASGGDGVVFQNGTYILDGPGLTVNGNFNGQASAPSTAVLRLTGSAGGSRPDTGQYSRLQCPLQIGAECNVSGSNTHGPYTIYFGASGNTLTCAGTLGFGAAGNYFQNSNGTSANFSFFGNITGDSVLAAVPQAPTNPLWLTQLLTLVNSGNALVASVDGTATSGGAIVLSPQSDTHGFIGIYSTSLGGYAYMVPNVANAHWAPSFGGAGGKGFGILGSSADTGAASFGVLNYNQTSFGLGGSNFAVLDNGTVVTLKNTLDDGNGNMTVAGVTATEGGTDTSGGATASVPSLSQGTAAQLSTTKDVMLYVDVKVATNLTLAIGPANTTTTTIFASATAGIGVIAVRVPKGWWVKASSSGTFSNFAFTQVSC